MSEGSTAAIDHDEGSPLLTVIISLFIDDSVNDGINDDDEGSCIGVDKEE